MEHTLYFHDADLEYDPKDILKFEKIFLILMLMVLLDLVLIIQTIQDHIIYLINLQII